MTSAKLAVAIAPYLAAFIAGLGLGLIYFGGLWLTVRQLGRTTSPGRLFFVSFAVRTAIAVAGIYWIGANEWQRIAVCLLGFIAMRTILTRRWGPSQASKGKTSPA